MEHIARAKSIVHSPAEDVLRAFTEPEQMSKFWFHRNDQGLEPDQSVTFYLGSDSNAYGFTVHVLDLVPASRLHVKWGDEDSWTEVLWLLEATENGDTILTIEESGFSGNEEEIINQVVDSTKGFNQVIVAAKAWLEHGVAINVVSDHA